METKLVLNDTRLLNDCIDKTDLTKELSSIFRGFVLAVKVIVLSAISVIYFIAGGIAVILYVIFYEKLFKTISGDLKLRRQKSPYYYKWKKHHLELYYEA